MTAMADNAHRATGQSAPTDSVLRQAGGEWVVTQADGVHAVLTDERFVVPEAAPGAPAGTLAWLRGSVCRFSNGAEHDRRLALVNAELAGLDPAALRLAAHDRAAAALAGLGTGTGPDNADSLRELTRRVPVAVLAAQFGAADPAPVADAVAAVADGYFPGCDAETERAADAAVQTLLDVLAAPGGEDATVARITVLVQGCDATANLIGAALALLPELPADIPAGALLGQTARHRPPVHAIRRRAGAPVRFGEHDIAEGDTVICDIDKASSTRTAAGERSAVADPDGAASALTFGYGLRLCPAAGHALALAAGVIDAVREGQ